MPDASGSGIGTNSSHSSTRWRFDRGNWFLGCRQARVRTRGGGWHKALVVGSVSLWRRLLASRPRTFCYDKQAAALRRASALPRASPCLGGESRMQLLPMASPDGLIRARYAVITKTPGWEVPAT